MKLLVVLGEGGHTRQMLKLVDLLGNRHDYYYVVTKADHLSAGKIKISGPVFRLTRPRAKNTGSMSVAFRTAWAALQALFVLLRVRPDAILSMGPAVAVPVAVIGKLLGARVIHIESGARIRTVSLTGRIMYRWADLFLVQWPQLVEQLPRAIYAGRLL